MVGAQAPKGGFGGFAGGGWGERVKIRSVGVGGGGIYRLGNWVGRRFRLGCLMIVGWGVLVMGIQVWLILVKKNFFCKIFGPLHGSLGFSW